MTRPNGKDREFPTTPSGHGSLSKVPWLTEGHADTELDRTELDPWREHFEDSIPEGRDIDGELLEGRMLVELFGGDPPEVSIGQYLIEQRLGRGGMGEVYAGRDILAGHEVAIKLLRPTDDLELDRKRLINEARALAKIKHPNVISLYHIGEHERRLFIVMERVRGQTLAQWQSESPGLRALLRVYAAAARGLAAAHRAGVVHGDFKPSNVLLANDGRVLVSDFGVASVHDERGGSDPSNRGGTLLYLAPERAAGQEGDGRSDQFSFFSALFQAVHGVGPVPGTTRGELLANLCEGHLVLAPNSKRSVPSWLQRAFERGLSNDPRRRFSSMDEVAALLERTRSRKLRLAAAWLGGAALLVAVGRATVPVPAATDDVSELLADVWSLEQQHAIAHDDSMAGPQLVGELDQWAEEWTLAYDSTSFVEWGAKSCLFAARARFGALVERLAEGGLTKRVALGSIAGLPVPHACATASKAVPAHLPEQARDEISRALTYADLARLEQRNDEAVGWAREALELAKHGKWVAAQNDALELIALTALAHGTPLQAYAFLDEAREHVRQRAYSEAERTLDRAIATLAHGLSSDARLEVQLRRLRADAIAAQGRAREQDAATAYLQTVELARERLGDADTVEETKLWSNAGVAAYDRQQYELAQTVFTMVLEQRRALLGPTDPLLASSLVHLAYVDVHFKKYDLALEHVNEALHILAGSEASRHLLSEAYGIMAMVHDARKQYAAALQAIDRAIATQPDGQPTPELSVQRAIFLVDLHRGDEALSIFEDALRDFEARAVSSGAFHDLIDVWITWLQLLHEQKNPVLVNSEFERISTSYDIEKDDLARLERAAFLREPRQIPPTAQEP